MGHVSSMPLKAIEARARRQLGLFTAAEARATGVSTQALHYHSTTSGRWVRLFPRVYAVAGLPSSERQRLLAALLWAGEGAVLSHRAAGFVLALDGMSAQPVPELWFPVGRAAGGVIVHRGAVPPADTCRSGPLRHTNLVRTVVDLGSVVDDDTLELVLESAIRIDRRCEPQLVRASRGLIRGSARLQRVLARRPPACEPTGSALESRFLQLIRPAGLPEPIRQFPVQDPSGGSYRLDFCWPEARLWVELDGREFHGRPVALFADRQRQNAIAATAGLLVLRFTWDDIVVHGDATVRTTREAYDARAATLAHRRVPTTTRWSVPGGRTPGGTRSG
jgi:very-short-patch-repair endonuclease